MAVAREITQHLLRAAEWALAIDHSLCVAQGLEIRSECLPIAQPGMLAQELQLTGLMSGAMGITFAVGGNWAACYRVTIWCCDPEPTWSGILEGMGSPSINPFIHSRRKVGGQCQPKLCER
jgi:hypothetical protein